MVRVAFLLLTLAFGPTGSFTMAMMDGDAGGHWDPFGSTTDAGGHADPNGGTSGVENEFGSSWDPNG